MKQYKILAIGNSFSQDATRFLHGAAASAGVDVKVVNLFIGGCSLERHWKNVESDETHYLLEINGVATDKYVSVCDTVEADKWDFIVTQQASHDSGWRDSYEPFAELLFGYLRKTAPSAELCMQQTWAYERDSDHGCFARYGRDQQTMYERLCAAYRETAQKHSLKLIPCGDAVQAARREKPFDYANGGLSLCRDGFHMDLVYGRYLLACTWVKTLFSMLPDRKKFVPENPAAPAADPKLLDTLIKVVSEIS